jgi:hypothetical protein
MAVRRWVFHDPYINETYTVPINPREMTSPFAEANITVRASTAVDGQVLLFQGQTPPANWSFTGAILDYGHYAAFEKWASDERRRRIRITDHYGRVLECVLLSFEPTPKRALGRPWRHEYTMKALVTKRPTKPAGV